MAQCLVNVTFCHIKYIKLILVLCIGIFFDRPLDKKCHMIMKWKESDG